MYLDLILSLSPENYRRHRRRLPSCCDCHQADIVMSIGSGLDGDGLFGASIV